MSDSLFDLYFSGQCIPNAPLETVKKNLATIFKADPARIETLFNGQLHCIKKGLDSASAQKYETVLRKAGAIVELRPQGTATPATSTATDTARKPSMAERLAAMENTTPTAPASQAPSAPAPAAATAASNTTAAASGGLQASAGYERLSPEAPPPPPAPDTSGLSTAETYERLSAEAPPPPPAPDTSHLSVAATGSLMGDAKAPVGAPELPNLDSISIAEVGSLMGTPKAPAAAPDLANLGSISLAPAGADLLNDSERKAAPPPAAPDTSHLSISKN